ncbi:hypothetical protein TNIN_218661 [Trichonephila inaurata madagascariensis]|uniref:Uncharacterized protein n=1 Tax=Trichonephila inaurata madagascariensis TaxID=2747483 RepID=A0A8X6YKR8_9ARAC|nr:hypothetical protein TNIN_218661 [Trichonephila inaurata madagascariensis]
MKFLLYPVLPPRTPTFSTVSVAMVTWSGDYIFRDIMRKQIPVARAATVSREAGFRHSAAPSPRSFPDCNMQRVGEKVRHFEIREGGLSH